MKITVKKVKSILKEEYQWTSLGSDANKGLITVLIKDVITIVHNSLKDKK